MWYNVGVHQDNAGLRFLAQSTRLHNPIVKGKQPRSCYLAVLVDSVDARSGLFAL